MRFNRIVPVAMEASLLDRESFHLRRLDLLANRIAPTIQSSLHAQPSLRSRIADEVDHRFVGRQRPTTPVLRDVAEEPVLDLVPLARARWEVTDHDPDPGLVREALQFELPCVGSVAIAASS